MHVHMELKYIFFIALMDRTAEKLRDFPLSNSSGHMRSEKFWSAPDRAFSAFSAFLHKWHRKCSFHLVGTPFSAL